MSTVLAELPVQDERVTSPSIPEFEVRPAELESPVAETQPKEETHPLWIVFVSCVVAFHVAAAMIGTLAAWVYQLRYSGALAP